ncbi:hypothetical protein CYMTET_42494 [Cymbomonas tetramitiformis]|uniref:Uncharacterized protein n=2 Tax=Cymbomonas tetramitiformis TaxID=36881 RepID=A0AAE0C3Y1_9CHLO|nr:hypothetical protein CYMTET_42494 [Cymbomonas tetramitiformis]
MAEVITPQPTELKRLGGLKTAVVNGSEYVSEKAGPLLQTASHLYDWAHQSVPSVLKPGLESIENAMVYYGKPLAEQAKEKAPQLLSDIDQKVDSTYVASKEVVEHQLERLQQYRPAVLEIRAFDMVKERFPEKYDTFQKARGQYLNLVEKAVGKVRSTLPEVPVDSIVHAIEHARTSAAERAHGAFEGVAAAWEKLLKQPQVAALLSKTAPTISIARGNAERAICALRENPRYQKYVLPLVQPIANTSAYCYLEGKLLDAVTSMENSAEPAPIVVEEEMHEVETGAPSEEASS